MLKPRDSSRLIPLTQRVTTPPPARTLDDAVRLCDPVTPLDPIADEQLHQDLDAVRRGNRLQRIVRNIRRSGSIPTLHFVTGHMGNGKTSELLRMSQTLQAEVAKAPIEVLWLDAQSDLDIRDVDLEDILVALWRLIFRQSPAIASKALGDIWKAKVRGLLANTAINLPDKVAEALDEIVGQLKVSPEQRRSIRGSLAPAVTLLIEGLNRALDALRVDATNQVVRDVVVIIDNLEKLGEGQTDNVERLYLERLGALKSLNAHLVITVPLALCFDDAGPGLTAHYGAEIVVLPMVKVREKRTRGGVPAQEGLDAVTALLSKRVDFGRLFEGGIEAARTVAQLSGGCIRHALRMVQLAVNEHDDPPVTADSVENGDPDPWYDVHPLVERCRKYQTSAES